MQQQTQEHQETLGTPQQLQQPPQVYGYPQGQFPTFPPQQQYAAAPVGYQQPPVQGYNYLPQQQVAYGPPPQQQFQQQPYQYQPYPGQQYPPGDQIQHYKPMNIQTSYDAKPRLEEVCDKQGFIRKVFWIVCTQLMVTVAGVANVMIFNDFRQFVIAYEGIAWAFFFYGMILLCVLTCSRTAARSVPKNYILLFNFTISLSYFVTYCAAMSSPKLVLSAAIITASLVLGLTLYAAFASDEITYCGGTAVILLSIILSCALCVSFFGNLDFNLGVAVVMILMGYYLIFDVKSLVRNRNHKLTDDDYIVAALFIYLDIIVLFVEILRCFSDKHHHHH